MGLPDAPWMAQPAAADAPFLKTDLTSSGTPNLNGDSSGPSEIGQAAGRAISAIPGMTPFSDLKDAIPLPTSASGDPVKDVMDSASKIMQFPFRLSQTMGALSVPADEAVKTHLESLGLEPHIAWALGKVAGMVVDPRNLAMLGEGGVGNLEGKDLGKIGGSAATEARDALASSYGVTLSPAEATQSKLVNVLEDLGNIYPYTGDDFQNFYQTRLSQADNIRARLMESIGSNKATEKVSDMMKTQIEDYLQNATPEQAAYLQDKFGDLDTYMRKPAAGQFTQSMLAQQRKVALDAAGAQFDALRAIVPDETPIKSPTFAAKAKEFLAQELNSKPSDRSAAWVKRLSEYAGVDTSGVPTLADGTPQTGPLYDAIQKELERTGQKAMESQMSYGATQMTMRKLRDLRISNDPGYLLGIKGQGNTYAGYAAELRGAMHDDIEGGLNSLSDQAKKALAEKPPEDPAVADHLQRMTKAGELYQTAKQNYAQTKDLMNDPFIIKLLKNDPEDFLDHAVKAQDITNVVKLKEILGQDNFVPVQQNLLANMLVDKTGEINPKSFVTKVDKIGYPTLSKVFDPKTMYEIGKSQEIFSVMKRGFSEGSQTGGRLMAKAALFSVPAEAYHLVMSGHPLSAGYLLAGSIGIPKALARMYLSDAGRDILIHGMVMPDKAAMALSLLGKGAMMSGLESARASAQPAQPQ